ncbi:hypothetical protein [Leptospira weilii]|uniref:Uncharacterized protein n=1 Tax=Leptospira weilii str. UI 13098 TaxID=1088542 RepID=M6QDE9_9LEPT|nr:hypothetical protein [Leptospira weilii]EMN91250.1 hypothetical protein LEP1GSC108_3290 [Leptospira weilii str. UI 13098]
MKPIKPKRFLVNGNVAHDRRFWRRGRILSQRLEQVIIESKFNLTDIAFKFSVGPNKYDSNLLGPIERSHLSKVIKGIRNTPRYVNALEESWKLPIKTIRQIYKEDKERESKGEKLNFEEIREFANWYISILKSQAVAS